MRSKKSGASYGEQWLTTHARKVFGERKLLDRLGAIAAGECVDTQEKYVKGQGRIEVSCPAPMTAQVAAIRELADRAFGTPTQAIRHSGEISIDGMLRLIERAERERGLGTVSVGDDKPDADGKF